MLYRGRGEPPHRAAAQAVKGRNIICIDGQLVVYRKESHRCMAKSTVCFPLKFYIFVLMTPGEGL